MYDREYWLTILLEGDGQKKGERKKKALYSEVVGGGRHAGSIIRKASSMKIAIEDSKRCNIPVVRKRLKMVTQRKGVDKMKSF